MNIFKIMGLLIIIFTQTIQARSKTCRSDDIRCTGCLKSYTLLIKSAESGDLKQVMEQVKAGVNIKLFACKPHNKDGDSKTALMFAVENNHIDVVKYLIKQGSRLHIKSRIDETLLTLAVKNNHVNMVQFLIKKGLKIDQKGAYKQTPLFKAIINHNIRLADYLITIAKKNKIILSFNEQDDWGRTSLLYAIKDKNIKTVTYLLKKKINIKQQSKEDQFPLMVAARYNALKIIKLLLIHGAKINQRSNMHNLSSIDTASFYGNLDSVLYLISEGAIYNHDALIEQAQRGKKYIFNAKQDLVIKLILLLKKKQETP